MFVKNEVLEQMKSRRSVRRYKSDMVPEELIEAVVTAGTEAASGMNRQTPVVIAVTNKEIRDRLSAVNAEIAGRGNSDPFYGAPVVLAVVARKEGTYIYDYGEYAAGCTFSGTRRLLDSPRSADL